MIFIIFKTCSYHLISLLGNANKKYISIAATQIQSITSAQLKNQFKTKKTTQLS